MSTETLYNTYRTPLFSMAYRMLGSVMDAEDIVQEAFLAYDQLPDAAAIRNERAFLYKIVTNRCLDLLRSSAKKRELYVGPWLPEPLLENDTLNADPSDVYLQKETISTAYLLLLQQLNAVERAVFLLREIFNYSYDEIADMIGKSSANCRQIFHRAQKSIHFDPEQTPSISVAEGQIKEFVNSLLQGNTNKLLELLSENVVLYSDGGGKVKAAQIPIVGMKRVAALLQNLHHMYTGKIKYAFVRVNGMPGIRLITDDQLQYIFSFAFHRHQIQTIYTVANPEKLRHV
ncbi:RNA polymerase sigma-70 factor [Paenibacillus allorhizosphaerae]|uniref:ECF RNA polymerase sigma factor SigJ n=1 Tax=Paenibacillus allorhizosphaerae TaxID=2849866 RepID=A0ABN7TWB1_9BACL|nr:RNA polymerase sigma-70 factor [Paenibacillus allorhizosphaerae]CAG7654769.1 ECF RNA polymerase sigma factor SigJ [Paenibacillus allorhizosphaerae]